MKKNLQLFRRAAKKPCKKFTKKLNYHKHYKIELKTRKFCFDN